METEEMNKLDSFYNYLLRYKKDMERWADSLSNPNPDYTRGRISALEDVLVNFMEKFPYAGDEDEDIEI